MYPKGWASERQYPVVKKQSQIFEACYRTWRERDPQKEAEIIDWLNNIVAGGNEISTNMLVSWTYPGYAAILAMAKKNQYVWNELSQEVKTKIDLLARCLLIAVAAIAADQNQDFHTGFEFMGNAGVNWSPNHRIAYAAPYLFLQEFFGGIENTDNILINFDYDTYLAEIRAAGFTNIEKTWTTTKIDENGNAFGVRDLLTYEAPMDGKGMPVRIQGPGFNVIDFGYYKGVRRPFWFKDFHGEELLYVLLDYAFPFYLYIKDSVEIDGTSCYIIDKTSSPYLNRPRMMRELEMSFRSCAFHGAISTALCIEMLVASLPLHFTFDNIPLNPTDGNSIAKYYQLMYNGTQDILYKLDHGYHSYDLFQENDHSFFSLSQFLPQLSIDRSLWEDLVNRYGDLGEVHW